MTYPPALLKAVEAGLALQVLLPGHFLPNQKKLLSTCGWHRLGDSTRSVSIRRPFYESTQSRYLWNRSAF